MNWLATQIPPHWQLADLGSLCEVGIGRTPSRDRPEYWGAGVPWLSIADMSQGHDLLHTKEQITQVGFAASKCKLTPAGTVLLSFKLSVGKVGITRVPLCTNEAIASLSIRDDNQLSADYLYWALRSMNLTLGLNRAAMGATLNKAKLQHLRIPVPPLPEQRRVAAILEVAEELRTKRRAAIAQLDTLAQSIFLEMFGDVRLSHKWPTARLGEAADIITGYPFSSGDYVTEPNEMRLCRGANVLPGRIEWADVALWPRARAPEFAEFVLREKDIVVAMDRPWITEGFKIAQVSVSDCPTLLVQRVARIRPPTGIASEYLYYVLRQPAFARHCRPTETTVPHISPTELRNYEISLPPANVQSAFTHRISMIERLRSNAMASLSELDTLFASLQHRAFRGVL